MRKSVVLFTLLAFILGLFCGVFIITNYNNKLILSTQNLIRTLSFQTAEKLSENQIDNENISESKDQSNIKKSGAVKYSEKDLLNIKKGILDSGLTVNSSYVDSSRSKEILYEDTIVQNNIYEDDEFVVKKEELIASKSIKINYIQQKKVGLDTNEQYLKNKLSISETNDVNKEIYTEFWLSPINYKGYKFNKKKLVLYGFSNLDIISIYLFNDNYYLKINSIPYILKPSEEYVSFAIVRDVELLKFLVNEN